MDFEFYLERRKQQKIFTGKKTLSQEIKQGIHLLIFTLLFFIIVLTVTFLINSSQSSLKDHTITQLQIKQRELEKYEQDLQNKIRNLKVLEEFEKDPVKNKMEKLENPEYIKSDKVEN